MKHLIIKNHILAVRDILLSVDQAAELLDTACHLVDQDRWYHSPHHVRDEFIHPYGPVTGSKRKLSAWLFDDPHARKIERANRDGDIWAVRNTRGHFSVWFQTEKEYLKAAGEKEK